VADPEYRVANEAIIAAIARANAANPSAQHIFDDGNELGWQLAAADVAITDVSAMVYDRLATGRPLIVTRPSAPTAEIDEGGYLGACEWLYADDAGDIVAIAERVQFDAQAQERLKFWVERHFGDTSPGEATRRFHRAIEKLMKEWSRHEKIHAADLRGSDSDPFDDDEDDESSPSGE
jgi:hypothetical protein